MRKVCVVGLLIAVVLLGVVVLKRTWVHRQPEYLGKPFVWWATIWCVGSTQEELQGAEVALRQMGTNCLPFVLSELQCSDNKPVEWLMQLVRRARIVRIQYDPPWFRRDRARAALKAIGPILGKTRLLELMAHRSQSVREAAADALAQLPVPEGQEALLDCLGSTDARVRAAATVGLRSGGYFPHRAIELLAQALADADAGVRIAAADSLVDYCRVYAGSVPAAALSNLVRSLEDPDPGVRRCSATALGLTKAQDAWVIAALTAATNDPDPQVRDSARAALINTSPDMSPRTTEMRQP
jgi:HEAT repeat protein